MKSLRSTLHVNIKIIERAFQRYIILRISARRLTRQRRGTQNEAPRRSSAQNSTTCPEITMPQCQARRAAALPRQFGPNNSEIARNGPKTQKFIP